MNTFPHYIKPNESSRLPRCHICIDTEATTNRAGPLEVQRWVLGAASHDHQRRKGERRQPTEWAGFATPEQLWAWVDERCQPGARTVLVAHNLAYDLRIADVFRILPELGWTLGGIALDGRGSWAIWKAHDRTLVMVDSLTWLPVGLDKVGAMVGLPKPPLPDTATPSPALLRRCLSDVAILREAWARIMGWLEDADMGNWRLSGSSMAWAAWRHRWYTHKVLVHGDQPLRDVEREASWTGRCEAWRHGPQRGGPWVEWDFAHAYAGVARDVLLPTRYIGHVSKPTWPKIQRWLPQRQVLARVTVTTDTPVVPTKGPDGILWPVGTFDSVLWDCELTELDRAGGSFVMHEAWVYDCRPALAAWGQWVCDVLDGVEEQPDPVVRMVIKHWSRSLIGRTALRFTTWRDYGRAPFDDCYLATVSGNAADGIQRMLHLGKSIWVDDGMADGRDAVPMVMSRIMSEARCRLWRAMTMAGLDHVLYVDTDSIITDDVGTDRLRREGVRDLAEKAEWRRARIMGPRQLELNGTLRAAGVPRQAKRVQGDTWRATYWRQLAHALASNEPDRVVVMDRNVRLRGTDHRRLHLPHGATAPVAWDAGCPPLRQIGA